MRRRLPLSILDYAIASGDNHPAFVSPDGDALKLMQLGPGRTHPINCYGPDCMKLPLAYVVPVLVSVAVLGQTTTSANARPRHYRAHAQTVIPATLPPSFDNSAATQAGATRAVAGKTYSRRMARGSGRYQRAVANPPAVRYATAVQLPTVTSDAPTGISPPGASVGIRGIGSSDLITEARRYLGGNPTGKSSLWCGNFMNLVLQRTGHAVSKSNEARSFAGYGQRVSGPQVGAIAVMSRKGGGHVGIVSGVDAKGNIIVISGNHGRRVAESIYPSSRIYAYVMPR